MGLVDGSLWGLEGWHLGRRVKMADLLLEFGHVVEDELIPEAGGFEAHSDSGAS